MKSRKRPKFKDKEAKKLANDQAVLKYENIQVFARKKLELLLSSRSLKDLHLTPGIRLEKLRGHKNLYSIRISRQYRILFIWENNEPWEIKINQHDKSYGK